MRVRAELDSTERAAREARSLIRDRLTDALPATTLYDLFTVVTELVTNAVRHGQGGPVRLRLTVAGDGTVTGEVENDGQGRIEPRTIDPARPGGLGLHIVSAIAHRWSVSVNGSTRVLFEICPP